MNELIEAMMTIRKEKKISREKIARDLGISAMTIYFWERGKFNPSGMAATLLKRWIDKNK